MSQQHRTPKAAGNRTNHKRTRASEKRAPRPIDAKLLHQIRREAAQMGLSTNQYLRLVTRLSSSLRKGILDDQDVDGSTLLHWVDNPVFLAMIQWISKYAVSTMKGEASQGQTDPDDGTGDSGSHSPLPATPGTTNPQPFSPSNPPMNPDPRFGSRQPRPQPNSPQLPQQQLPPGVQPAPPAGRPGPPPQQPRTGPHENYWY